MGVTQSYLFGNSQEQVEESFDPLPTPQVIQSTGLPAFALARPPQAPEPPKELSFRRRKVSFTVESNSIKSEVRGDHLVVSFEYLTSSTLAVTVIINGKSVVKTELCAPESPGYLPGTVVIPYTVVLNAPSGSFDINLTDGHDLLDVKLRLENTNVTVISMRLKMESDEEPVDLLQLYGGSSSHDTPDNKQVCAVCLSEPIAVGFLPCRHVCVCSDCAEATLRSCMNQCPMCRQPVHGLLRLHQS